MKILPKYRELFVLIGLPFLFIFLAFAFFFRAQLLLSLTAHWFLLFIAIVVALSPLGKIKLGNTPPLSLYRWSFIFLIAGLGIIFLYYGLLFIVARGIPIAVPNHYPVNAIAVLHLTFAWGWYPWCFMLLVAIAMGYFTGAQGKPGKLSIALEGLFNSHKDDAISIVSDFFVRGVIAFSLSSSLAILNLILLTFFLQWLGLALISNITLSTLTLVTVFITVPTTQYWHKGLRLLLRKKIPYGMILLLYSLVITLLLVLAHIISSIIASNFPGWTEIRSTLPSLNWPQIWLILTAMWWLSWTAPMTALIVYLSRGLSIRKIIVMSGLMILILQVVLFAITIFPRFQHSTWLPLILTIIGFLFILGTFFRQDYFIYAMRGTIPTTAHEKPRSLFYALQRILQNATLFTILYLLTGIYLPALFSILIVLPFAFCCLFCVIAFLWSVRVYF